MIIFHRKAKYFVRIIPLWRFANDAETLRKNFFWKKYVTWRLFKEASTQFAF